MIVDYLIARAKRTPYFHLAGYMRRWWLVPYVSAGSAATDGCGRVSWRRPIARVLQALGIAIRVHEILRSDTARDPHNHPWPYLTIILRGGYWESRYDADGVFESMRWHGPGSVLFRRASDLHRLTLPRSALGSLSDSLAGGSDFRLDPGNPAGYKPATTLFVTGRYVRKWGFVKHDGTFVPHNEYPR